MAKSNLDRISNITPYPEINEILISFVKEITELLADNICGVYLTGSLSYGDFNKNSSDIDITVILNNTASPNELGRIKEFHIQFEKGFE